MISERLLEPEPVAPPALLGLTEQPTSAGNDRWRVTFDPDWRSFPTNMHGGVLLGTVTGVAARAVRRWPAAVSAHLHAAVQPGPAELLVRPNRSGRTASSVDVALEQGDTRLSAIVELTADPPGAAVGTWPDVAVAAALAGPAPAGLAAVQLPTELALMAQQLDIRPTGSTRPLAGGDVPELSAWVRLREDRPCTPDVAAMLLDVLPPALYATRTSPVPIPTIELTAHFPPVLSDGDWFLCRQRTSWSTGELCVDSSEVWDAAGRLVGEARQLRRIIGG